MITVGDRRGTPMDTSICEEIWQEMCLQDGEPAPEQEPVADQEEAEDTKLPPKQRLEKQIQAATEKLDKIRARQGSAKQTNKQKESDPKEIEKLEAKLTALNTKLGKFTEKKGNFEKWTPTWKKHFATSADAAGQEVSESLKTDFVSWVDKLPSDEFKKKSYSDLATQFFSAGTGLVKKEDAPHPNTPALQEDDDEDLDVIVYDDEEYAIGAVSRRVYKQNELGIDTPVLDLALCSAVLKKYDNLRN
jgi:hypothetical protein